MKELISICVSRWENVVLKWGRAGEKEGERQKRKMNEARWGDWEWPSEWPIGLAPLCRLMKAAFPLKEGLPEWRKLSDSLLLIIIIIIIQSPLLSIIVGICHKRKKERKRGRKRREHLLVVSSFSVMTMTKFTVNEECRDDIKWTSTRWFLLRSCVSEFKRNEARLFSWWSIWWCLYMRISYSMTRKTFRPSSFQGLL